LRIKTTYEIPKKRIPLTRILVADDDKDVRTALRDALASEGYEVETAPDGERAMQMHENAPANILITDLFMPEQDGLETLQYFRARDPSMPIVVISGWKHGQKTDHLAVAQHAGANVILRKPFELGELLARLETLISEMNAAPKDQAAFVTRRK
jgi:DNA-binding response OmpR family regulator